MKSIYLISLFIFPFILCNCSDFGVESEDQSSTDEPVQIIGTAQLGPISGATVTAYLLNADGSRGDLVASALTDSSGSYLLEILPGLGSLVLAVSGGSYTEESGGSSVNMEDRELLVVVSPIMESSQLAITALTHMAAQRTMSLRNSGVELTEAINTANQELAQAAGLQNIYSPPANPEGTLIDADEESRKYALFLAGLSRLADEAGIDSFEASNAFGNDFHQDGQFDGSDDGSNILLGSSGDYLGNDDWSNDLDQAMDDFIASGDNTAGFVSGDATDPIVDAIVDIPSPTLDPIISDPMDPMFFGLEAPMPLPVGVCIPVNLLVLDHNMRIVPLKEPSTLVNSLAFDPYLAQIFSDGACSLEVSTSLLINEGVSSVPLYIRANSSGYLDFHNYHIESVSGAQAPLLYLGSGTIFADPYAPGSMVPEQFDMIGSPTISVGSCEAYQLQFFDIFMNSVELYNGGEIMDMFPQPNVYEFHMDPSCTTPMSSVVPIMPGPMTTIYVKGLSPGSLDLFNLQLFSYGAIAPMPLLPIGSSTLTVF